MWWLLGLAIVVLGLIVSVALHEFGHLIPAKKFGAAVPEYWVGFGPKLWSFQRGGTTYGVKAILLGGYVRILGMFAPTRPGMRTTNRRGEPTMAEEARAQSAEELKEARESGVEGVAFYELSTPKKLGVMAGGPLMNLVICIALTAAILLGYGVQTPTVQLESVSGEVNGEPGPAAQAGLEPGDTVVSWGGVGVDSWDELRGLIQETPADGTQVVVDRDGERVSLWVVPTISSDGARTVGIVSRIERRPGSLAQVGSAVWEQFAGTARAIVGLPVGLYNLAHSMLTGGERDQGGVMSVVGIARLAGEITSPDSMTYEQATPTGTVTVAPSMPERLVMLLSLLASLNMALFVFNLIPLPPLDGGHVVGALYGGARNAWAKLRGKPKPQPANTAAMMPVTYVVFFVLIGMTILLAVADVLIPITIS